MVVDLPWQVARYKHFPSLLAYTQTPPLLHLPDSTLSPILSLRLFLLGVERGDGLRPE